MRRSLLSVALTMLLAVFVGGCSGEPGLYPAKGTLTVAGKPAAGALLVFHPKPGSTPIEPKPTGLVKADGSFDVTTGPHQGAPVGDYVVTVYWAGEPPAKPNGGMAIPDEKATVTDQLGGRYRDPTTSQLPVTIKASSNTLEPIKLD